MSYYFTRSEHTGKCAPFTSAALRITEEHAIKRFKVQVAVACGKVSLKQAILSGAGLGTMVFYSQILGVHLVTRPEKCSVRYR